MGTAASPKKVARHVLTVLLVHLLLRREAAVVASNNVYNLRDDNTCYNVDPDFATYAFGMQISFKTAFYNNNAWCSKRIYLNSENVHSVSIEVDATNMADSGDYAVLLWCKYSHDCTNVNDDVQSSSAVYGGTKRTFVATNVQDVFIFKVWMIANAEGDSYCYNIPGCNSQVQAGFFGVQVKYVARCVEGFTSIDNGPCTACGPGSYSSGIGRTGVCLGCAVGKYQPASAKSSCMDCPLGSRSEGSAAQCTPCKQGTYWDGSFHHTENVCTSCQSGKYNPDVGSSSSTSCRQCLPGTFSGDMGSAACKTCGPGKYQDRFGQSNCELCPAGKVSIDLGATSVGQCQACDKVRTVHVFLAKYGALPN